MIKCDCGLEFKTSEIWKKHADQFPDYKTHRPSVSVTIVRDNPHQVVYNNKIDVSTQDGKLARLRQIDRELEILRHNIFTLELEARELAGQLVRVEYKATPKYVTGSTLALAEVECHYCGKLTRDRVNGLPECRKHSISSGMSKGQLEVMNEFLDKD